MTIKDIQVVFINSDGAKTILIFDKVKFTLDSKKIHPYPWSDIEHRIRINGTICKMESIDTTSIRKKIEYYINKTKNVLKQINNK